MSEANLSKELAHLPKEVRRRIFMFMRHPVADLVGELFFIRRLPLPRELDRPPCNIPYSFLGVVETEKGNWRRVARFRHTVWSGEPVWNYGRLHNPSTSDLHYYRDGIVDFVSLGVPHPSAPFDASEIERLFAGALANASEKVPLCPK
jgi:hypothetical protein